jgi:hypothetical protein
MYIPSSPNKLITTTYKRVLTVIHIRGCLEASQKIEVSKFRTSKMGFENAQQTDNSCMLSGGIPKHRTFELSYFPTIWHLWLKINSVTLPFTHTLRVVLLLLFILGGAWCFRDKMQWAVRGPSWTPSVKRMLVFTILSCVISLELLILHRISFTSLTKRWASYLANVQISCSSCY